MPPFGFTDEQLKGPYRQRIHEYTFDEVDNMTVVGDHVRYAVPGGNLINQLFREAWTLRKSLSSVKTSCASSLMPTHLLIKRVPLFRLAPLCV